MTQGREIMMPENRWVCFIRPGNKQAYVKYKSQSNIKNLEDGENRHFVGDFYDDIYFYSIKRLSKKIRMDIRS